MSSRLVPIDELVDQMKDDALEVNSEEEARSYAKRYGEVGKHYMPTKYLYVYDEEL